MVLLNGADYLNPHRQCTADDLNLEIAGVTTEQDYIASSLHDRPLLAIAVHGSRLTLAQLTLTPFGSP